MRRPRRKRNKLTLWQQALVSKYLPMAKAFADKMARIFPAIGDEFVGVCFLALVEAAEAFDPTKNVKFSTFARFRLIGAIKSLQRQIKKTESIIDYEIIEQSSQWVDEIDKFKYLLRGLNAQEKEVIFGTFVLDQSQAEVARRLKITRSRVSAVYINAITYLQSPNSIIALSRKR